MEAPETAQFGWPDYLVFSLMLLASAAIGVFYGFFSKKEKDETQEFLMAGKSMTTFPIAMSLIASFMSAIGLLGAPSEVYQTGFVYYLIIFSYFIAMPAAAYLYLPVFWDMQVTSTYEYLEKRFSPGCRRLGSFCFMLQMTMYMAIVVFAPSLALAQMTGMNLYLSVCLICFVCIFYTTLGGMKAVLWTDALQVVIMYSMMAFITFYGAVAVGGFDYVWERAVESGRAELINVDPNPTTRHTVWSLVIGGYFVWVSIYGVNQAQVQRYMCVSKLYMARQAIFINLFGLLILQLVQSYSGLVMYAHFFDCDPIKSKQVQAGDQLFPLFVMEKMGQFRGLPGLFVAGVFSGSLSTVSSGINSLAAIFLEDFVKGFIYPQITPKQSAWASKLFTFMFGLITFILSFVAEHLGNVLAASLSVNGMIGGLMLGMFSLGMFFPWANAIGCLIGCLVSMVIMFWILIGANIAKAYGINNMDYKPTSIENCSFTFNVTHTHYEPAPAMWTWEIFQISYMWYSMLSCLLVIFFGLIISFITGKQDIRSLDPATLSPGFHWVKRFIPGMDQLGADLKPQNASVKYTETVPLGLQNKAYQTEKETFVLENKNDQTSNL